MAIHNQFSLHLLCGIKFDSEIYVVQGSSITVVTNFIDDVSVCTITLQLNFYIISSLLLVEPIINENYIVSIIRFLFMQTPHGRVELKHYEVMLRHDLNTSTGLRAVPKLTDKHISPNNFQKMSVKVAAQVCLHVLQVVHIMRNC
jgi:hypothetical protein